MYDVTLRGWEKSCQLIEDCEHDGGKVTVLLNQTSLTLLLVEGEFDERRCRLTRVPHIFHVQHWTVAA